MTTLNDDIEQGLTYIGRWAVHLETNKQVIIVDTEEHNFGYTAIVLVPGEEVLKTVPAGDLRLIPSSVWNDEGVPQRFAEWESTLDVENFVKLQDIPQNTRRKLAEDMKGCWVEQLGLYYLIVKYKRGAIGDFLITLNPITSAIKYVDIDDDLRLLPLEFREWGETTPEFLAMLEKYAPQPEAEKKQKPTVRLYNSDLPATEYVGHWVEENSKGKRGIMTSVNGQFAQVLYPGETETHTIACVYLEWAGRVAWNDRGIPSAFDTWDPTHVLDSVANFTDIPQNTLRKFAKELEGCWVERYDAYYLVAEYREGAVGDYLVAARPALGDVGVVEIDEDLRILPPQFREWGWNSPEFLGALKADKSQPKAETTKPEEVDETDTRQDGLRELIDNEEVRPGQWLRNKVDGDEYIFIKVDKSDEFKGEWAQVFDPSEGALRNFPMSYLEPMTAYAWTKDHLPIPIPYHLEPPSWDIAPIEISHLPKTFISEFGSELSGCWAYIDDSLMVITAIIEGAVYAISPKEGYDLRYDHSESLLLNPIMLRAWGNPSAEFCDAIMRHDLLHRNKTTDTNEEQGTQDAINPGHYRGLSNNTEVIDITENLTFAAGNVVKYVVRATRIDGAIKNNPVQDLEKARWYLDREIQRLKNT